MLSSLKQWPAGKILTLGILLRRSIEGICGYTVMRGCVAFGESKGTDRSACATKSDPSEVNLRGYSDGLVETGGF